MKRLLLLLPLLLCACGRDVGLSTAPPQHCPETTADSAGSLIAANMPTVVVYSCRGIVPK